MTAPSADRRELHWLQDILEAIDKIQSHPQFARGKEAFNSDDHFRVWVLYYVERIGECASYLRREFNYDVSHPEADWRGTVGMRRQIVHRYWDTDYDLVWDGVKYLPELKKKVEAIIKEKKEE